MKGSKDLKMLSLQIFVVVTSDADAFSCVDSVWDSQEAADIAANRVDGWTTMRILNDPGTIEINKETQQ